MVDRRHRTDAVARVAADRRTRSADRRPPATADVDRADPPRRSRRDPGHGRVRRRAPKGRKLKVTVGVVLLLAAIGALAVAGWALVRTKSYTVPDLVGIQEEVALNEISGNDWTVERELERSDEFPEPGTVIRTVPAAGIKLDEGETFVIVRQRGPRAAGAARAERDAARRGAGGAHRTARSCRSKATPAVLRGRPGRVGDQLDRAGRRQRSSPATRCCPDTAIVLVLSQGPAPRPAPNLANMTLEEADGGHRRGAAARRRGRAAVQQRRRGRPRRHPDARPSTRPSSAAARSRCSCRRAPTSCRSPT